MKKVISLFLIFCFIITVGCSNKTNIEDEFLNDDETTVVYVTKTGECYHRSGCSSLKKSKIEKDLYEVEGKYRPCSICDPPTY